jgi:hypothetical protein
MPRASQLGRSSMTFLLEIWRGAPDLLVSDETAPAQ